MTGLESCRSTLAFGRINARINLDQRISLLQEEQKRHSPELLVPHQKHFITVLDSLQASAVVNADSLTYSH